LGSADNSRGTGTLLANEGDTDVLRNIQWPEILLILLVVVLLFGATKLPDLARSIGASAKEFRKGLDEGAEDDESPE
jgi:sec-independent protein translocase protein TatA